MIHTPLRSKKNFQEISRFLKGYKDVSWKNDWCDSIYNEEQDIQIHLPNSDKIDLENEEVNTYLVISNQNGKIEDEKRSDHLNGIEELLNYIENL